MDKKPHLVKWSTVCANKRNGGLGVKDLSILNRALLCKWIWCLANEKDALWRNVIAGNLGRNEEAGSLVLLEVLMGQVFGRRLERNRIQSFPMSFSLWGMVEGCASGRMFGVERRLFVILFPPCMLWLTTRRCWWLICGTLLRRKEDRSLALLDLSMIENWMRYSLFSIPFKESKLLRVKKI